VFEQQHCNYEQVFGQAFVVGDMCTAVPAMRQPKYLGRASRTLANQDLTFSHSSA
jgi:hypothetical protein